MKAHPIQQGTIGVGIDVISVSRMRRFLQTHGERLVGNFFTVNEVQSVLGDSPDHTALSQNLSYHNCRKFTLLFASKEAVLKALSPDRLLPFEWCDIDTSSIARIRLDGTLRAYARGKAIDCFCGCTAIVDDLCMAVFLATGTASG